MMFAVCEKIESSHTEAFQASLRHLDTLLLAAHFFR